MPAEASHRRGPAIADMVLDATLGLLATRGYAFSIEEVAAVAGVHKTTIYRRWETKAALVVAAAVGRLAAQDIPVERTSDPVADLTTLAILVARSLRRPAAVQALRAVVAAAGEDHELLPTARRFLADRYQLAIAIVDDAIALGTLRAGIDATLVWEAIVNPLHLRAIMGAPASDDVAQSLVALVVQGAGRHNSISRGAGPGPTKVQVPLVECVHPASAGKEMTPERVAEVLLWEEAAVRGPS